MKRYWKIALLYLLVTIVVFPGIYFSKLVFFAGDNFTLLAPGRIFLVNQLKRQVLPYWNPYIYSGIPFLADISQTVFYFSTFIFYLFSISNAMNITIIVHCIIIALGTYDLTRRVNKSESYAVLSGILLMLSQPTLLAISGNITVLQSFTWVPWIISISIASLRRPSFYKLLPGLFSLSLLGGHPQPSLVGMSLSVSILLLFSKERWITRLLRLSGIAVTSFALLLFILFPVAELSNLSTRSHMVLGETLLSSSTHPLHLLDSIIPNFYLNPRYGMIWGINWNLPPKGGLFITYFGLLSLLMTVLFWKKTNSLQKFFFITGILFLLFSFGKYVPGFTWFYVHFPFASWFRNIPLMSYGYFVSVAVLLPFGLKHIQNSLSQVTKVRIEAVSTILFVLVSSLFLFYSRWFPLTLSIIYSSLHEFHTYPRDYIIGFNALSNLAVSLGLFSLGMMMLRKHYPEFLFSLVIMANLIFCNLPHVILAPRSIYEANNPLIHAELFPHNYRHLSIQDYMPYVGISNYWSNMSIAPPFGETHYTEKEKSTYESLLLRRNTLAPDWNMTYQLASTNGYSTFVPSVVANFWKQKDNTSNVNMIDYVGFIDQRLNDQGVKTIVTEKLVFPDKSIPKELREYLVVKDTDEWAILDNSNALPIIRYASYPQGNITLLPGTTNEINFEAENATDSAVLIKVTPYPGWSCKIDGQICQIQADGLGMKMFAPAGKHNFRLSFTPSGWPYIAWISGCVWIWYLFFIKKELKKP